MSATGNVNLEGRHRIALFHPGDVIASRYLIIRYINHGAMGVVYEALDQQLNDHIALKAIRVDTANNPKHVERFKREIQLARRVTHPNVCRIFDVGFHDLEPRLDRGWFGGDVTFLTMELLLGQSLEQLIADRGVLEENEAKDIVAQIASGLAAAHDAGVIHGDLKSANVLMVPEEQGLRAVVTDFGLARTIQADGHFFTTVGGMDQFVGTPAFMAPEQVDGGALNRTTDIYALGCVFYQLVTGQVPFIAENMIQTALMRLVHDPVAPIRKRPDLSRQSNRVILKCLKRQQSDRFQSAESLLVQLSEERVLPVKLWLATGLFLALSSLAVFFFKDTNERVTIANAPAVKNAEPLVMSLTPVLVNLGDDDRTWLARWATTRLSESLAKIEESSMVSEERLERAYLESGFELNSQPTLKLQQIIAKQVGASWSFSANLDVRKTSPKYHFELRAMESERGRYAFAFEQNADDLAILINDAVIAFSKANHRLPPNIEDFQLMQPGHEESLVLFEEGRRALWSMEITRAIDVLNRAAAEQNEEPKIHLWLALAQAAAGEQSLALASLDRSMSLVPDSLAKQEFDRYVDIIDEFSALVRSFQSLFRTSGTSSVDQNTIEILAQLTDKFPNASIAEPQQSSTPSLATPTRQLLTAGAISDEAQAFIALRDPEQALKLFAQGLSAYQQAGDLIGEARTRHNIGIVLFDLNRLHESEQELMLALHIWQEKNRTEQRLGKLVLAEVKLDLGKNAEGERLALSVYDDANSDDHEMAKAAHFLAKCARYSGNSSQESYLATSILRYSKSGENESACRVRLDLARFYQEQSRWQEIHELVNELQACRTLEETFQAQKSVIEAQSHMIRGNHLEAEQALAPFSRIQGSWTAIDQAWAHRIWGIKALSDTDVVKARQEIEMAASLFRSQNNDTAWLECVSILAPLYFDLGLYALASRSYHDLIEGESELLTRQQYQNQLADVLYQEAGLHRASGDLSQSIAKLTEAISNYEACQQWRKVAVSRELLSQCFARQDNGLEAVAELNKAIDLWLRIDEMKFAALSLYKLALQYEDMSNDDLAIENYVRGANQWAELGDRDNELRYWQQIHRVSNQALIPHWQKEAGKRIRQLERQK